MSEPPLPAYEEDFFAWTQAQAELLRREAELRGNAPLDWLNLAEEIESVGLRDKRELTSRIEQIVLHLLKLEHSPAVDPRRGWRETVVRERNDIEAIFAQSPSLRREPEAALHRRWPAIRRLAAEALSGEVDPRQIPKDCPYRIEQVLDPEFWPEPQPQPAVQA